jgi:hypothetical protein
MRAISSAIVVLAVLFATEASAQSINLTGAYKCVEACRAGPPPAVPLSSPRTDLTSIFSTKPVSPPGHGLTCLRPAGLFFVVRNLSRRRPVVNGSGGTGKLAVAYKAARCRARVAFCFRATMEAEPCDEGKPT